ncbi:MAG: S-layer homology domain-containing protein [Eubacteriales bacterium]|nr:S-layer homology domain-containing protein [Eubacteriales bacterium]
MKESLRKAAALLLAVVMLLPGTGAFAAGDDGGAVIPPDNAYEFANGVINGLEKDYLLELTEAQRQSLRLVIPAEIGGVPVTAIRDRAFQPDYYMNTDKPKDCVYELDFSKAESLKTIGGYAFRNCAFRGALQLPESLTAVGDWAFAPDSGSQNVFSGTLSIPASVETLGSSVFADQLFTKVEFAPESKLTDLKTAFRNCQALTGALYLPAGVEKLASSAFSETKLETIYLPKGITVDDYSAFPDPSNGDLKAIVCDPDDYDRMKEKLKSSSQRAAKLGYPVTVAFRPAEGAAPAELKRLYNQPLNLVKQADGAWRTDAAFQLPEVTGVPEGYEGKWSFSQDEPQAVSQTSVVSGDTLYAFYKKIIEPPTIVYSDGIDKVYDGSPSVLSATATHPLYRPSNQMVEGAVHIYYFWGWYTINGGVEYDKQASGWDKNTYDIGSVRAPYPIACRLQIQAYIIENGEKKFYYAKAHDFEVDLRKGTPKVTPQYPKTPFPYGNGALPGISAEVENDIPGSIQWSAGQTLQPGGSAYQWTFTPSDTKNYNIVSGAAYLYAYEEGEAAEAPKTEDILEELIPETPQEPVQNPDQQKNILDAKILVETTEETVSDDRRQAINEALAKLPQVEIAAKGGAVQDEAALLENMTAEDAYALRADDNAKYQIVVSMEDKEPSEGEKTAIEAVLDGAAVGDGQAVTVNERLTVGGKTEERQLDELRRPIKLVFTVPPEMAGAGRAFSVARTHTDASGIVHAALLPDEDSEPATVTVSSDRFSYYALVYWETGGSSGHHSSGNASGSKPAQPDPEEPGPAETLEDIAGHWAEAEIRAVVDAGIFRGTSETLFEPEGTMTRGMLVTGLYRLAGGPSVDAAAAFADVAPQAWYADAVAWGASEKLVNGFEDGCFRPADAVTREQAAAFLYRDALRRGLVQSGSDDLQAFQDGGMVSPWARGAVGWAVRSGLLAGKPGGRLEPGETATRAETAVLFHRYIELTKHTG